MKYEFHVGDYVETKNGAKGYVKDPKNLWWVCTVEANGYTPGLVYSIIGVSNNETSEFFNRIGQYDFIKKDKGKIDKLNLQGYLSVQSVSETVNELIEAVNRLEEKVSGMA